MSPAIEPYPESIQPITSQPVSLMSILILSSHQHLDLAGGIYLSGFLAKLLYEFLSIATHATCPAHPIVLDSMTIIITGEEYKLWSGLFYAVWCILLLIQFQICKSNTNTGSASCSPSRGNCWGECWKWNCFESPTAITGLSWRIIKNCIPN